jgi:integrase
MRGLFAWAVSAEHIPTDPTVGKAVTRVTGKGFEAWDDDDIANFRRRWPLGTRERVALDVLFYTGLRRGDAAIFGRQHVKDGVGRVNTEKNRIRAIIPIEPELAETLRIGPCGDLTFIATGDGKPFKKESLGNWFSEACQAAGIKKSAHGLRKAAATRDINRGWTEAELDAKYGWIGGRMAAHYTKTMNRERLAIQAAKRTATVTPIREDEGSQ